MRNFWDSSCQQRRRITWHWEWIRRHHHRSPCKSPQPLLASEASRHPRNPSFLSNLSHQLFSTKLHAQRTPTQQASVIEPHWAQHALSEPQLQSDSNWDTPHQYQLAPFAEKQTPVHTIYSKFSTPTLLNHTLTPFTSYILLHVLFSDLNVFRNVLLQKTSMPPTKPLPKISKSYQ